MSQHPAVVIGKKAATATTTMSAVSNGFIDRALTGHAALQLEETQRASQPATRKTAAASGEK